MGRIAAALKTAGYVTLAPNYRWRSHSLGQMVAALTPVLAAFEARLNGPLHFVTHSLGGLVARGLITASRPARLGRVVMLGPPNAGSELADLAFRLHLHRLILGPVGAHLRTVRSREDENLLGPVDFDLGVIAGSRPLDPLLWRLALSRPNDGKVTIAATRIAGMADHIVLPVSHILMTSDPGVIAQIGAFLGNGRFLRPQLTPPRATAAAGRTGSR